MPSETGAAPSIDDFIVRKIPGPCIYVRATTPELRKEIEGHETFKTEGPKWTAYARWLETQGIFVSPDNIKQHYVRHLDGH